MVYVVCGPTDHYCSDTYATPRPIIRKYFEESLVYGRGLISLFSRETK